MANKMLIDAAHPEETRVVVVHGNRVEEFDFEAANRKQLRGNIYLAKVTRVEPSLQAAFVEYGGNRHGFLAFSEIHPDYYQIPVADRHALLAEEKRAPPRGRRRGRGQARRSEPPATRQRGTEGRRHGASAADGRSEPNGERCRDDGEDAAGAGGRHRRGGRRGLATATPNAGQDEPAEGDDVRAGGDEAASGEEASGSDEEHVEALGGGDALEDVPERPRRPRRQYKIQEVIKRRQILLVQVVKEERGNKGAALTTYLSLAGRYSVLMPNTARGGGI